MDLSPEPDLHPIYPAVAQLSSQISSQYGLNPEQKAKLVAHCLLRSCVFGDFTILQFLLSDPQAQSNVDLGFRDEDGVGLITLAIQGFGGDPDRDVEREECVRLLASQGADMSADKSGWTPLHYAALLAPPTLVSYLMTHGCSPFAHPEKKLTPLNILTAHSTVPGREDAALLLEEAMRGQGWKGGHIEEKRKLLHRRMKSKGKQRKMREDVAKALDLSLDWWQHNSDLSDSESDDDEDEFVDEHIYTPRLDYSTMLAFSPAALPQIFDSLITNYRPRFKDATPANMLYMLARFAALTCDYTWLEDLLVGAADAIEETFFSRSEELSCLVFWLYNTTIWLHLLECDNSIREACEMLGSFELIEEAINSVFVFIIRYAEQKIDQLLDSTILSYTSSPADFEAVQFESEWSFLRFASKKKASPPSPKKPSASISAPTPSRPLSPIQGTLPSTSRSFSSLRETISRARGQTTPLSALFQDTPPPPPPPSPLDLINFLTSLHMLLVLSDINPAITTQLWSQVMYWTSCEIFNRTITRKKYLCRSRASQISINLTSIYEWIEDMELPAGIHNHFAPVRDLLNWLQQLSSITEFSDLVETIQTMKNLNPLQMRRAVREYKFEVNESRMTDECVQYLTQVQKDWERHRVKLGVEAIKKEISERDRDRESQSSLVNDTASVQSVGPSESSAYQSIDVLFDRTFDKSLWEPARPPQALGELLDSRFMISLLFPSDPRHLAALPGKQIPRKDDKRVSMLSFSFSPTQSDTVLNKIDTPPASLSWRSRNRKIREVRVQMLRWIDGGNSAVKLGRATIPHEYEYEREDGHIKLVLPDPRNGHQNEAQDAILEADTQEFQATPLTRRPSGRAKARHSVADINSIETGIDA